MSDVQQIRYGQTFRHELLRDFPVTKYYDHVRKGVQDLRGNDFHI